MITAETADAQLAAAVPEGLTVIPNLYFDTLGWYRVATEVLHLQDDEAREWIEVRFAEVLDYVGTLKKDDTILQDGPSDEAIDTPLPGLPIYGVSRLLPIIRKMLTEPHIARAFQQCLEREEP